MRRLCLALLNGQRCAISGVTFASGQLAISGESRSAALCLWYCKIWRRAVADYLKSAAQLRELAAKISDPEARQRIISVAEEYEAIAVSREATRKATKALLEGIPEQATRGKQLH